MLIAINFDIMLLKFVFLLNRKSTAISQTQSTAISQYSYFTNTRLKNKQE